MKILRVHVFVIISFGLMLLIASQTLYAQGLQSGAIAKGVDKATTELQDVGKSVGDLMLPLCLIMGFVGGIQCASKFFNNDPDFKKGVINWGAAIIFAGVVGLVLTSAFGK
ncbi:DUF4134 domain-containing protein [Spirosoma sp. HMF3257]|uniref:Uncharacterized protein n=1 Tax=Spirosoma telluris TaxID=2183553 RepID=A0A327NGE2_9BACT|nr:DUF4134 domain-containing protein [Spirosoma telluris]RAI73016.1 hypothetical protein HMF3257_38525 [Spirosoma telluris]